MNKILSIYDDQGVLTYVSTADFDSEQEAAICLINKLMGWSESEGREIYQADDIKHHVRELDTLKTRVRNQLFELDDEIWFETSLGFKLSMEESAVCGKYPEEEVLPNQNGRCSLCGSLMNEAGECLYLQ